MESTLMTTDQTCCGSDDQLGLCPFTVSVEEASRLSGLGKTTLYKLMAADALHSTKVAGRRLVHLDSLKALLMARGTPPPDRAE